MSKKIIGGLVCSVVAVIGIIAANYSDEIRSTERGLLIIGNAEGCRREPYKCPANVLSVGIGSTEAGGEPIEPKKRYTDDEIARRWVRDIQIAEQCVNRFANGNKLPLSVFESLTSITFNVGCVAIRDIVTPIKSSRLQIADAKSWYLLNKEAIEVSYLDGVDTPYIEQQQGFSVDGVVTKVRIDAGVNVIDYRGVVKVTNQ